MTVRTRPTPRGRQERPNTTTTALICVLIILALALIMWMGFGQRLFIELEQEPEAVIITHDSLGPTYTSDGEIIRWYVFTDPDYGKQYLVNDRGGTTPRLNQYVEVIGVSVG